MFILGTVGAQASPSVCLPELWEQSLPSSLLLLMTGDNQNHSLTLALVFPTL